MAQTHIEHHSATGGTLMLQLICGVLAGLFELLRNISIEDFQKWTFWILSMCSLVLTIWIQIQKIRDRKNNRRNEA